MIKAIIFDIDGVLIDSLDANFELIKNIMKAAGYKKPLKHIYRKNFHLPAIENFKILSGTDDNTIIDGLMKMLAERHDLRVPFKITKDSVTVLKDLSKKYKLGIVTSRTLAGVEYYLELSKAEQYFDTIVHFGQYKNHKPHPEPLLLACKKLKVKPTEAIYIGDAHTDIEAAHAAGMEIILYPKRKLKEADYYAKEFTDIPKIISNL